ncbi:MAG: hypothetical protein IT378_02910, partial [Sandaracinaceae bacterium]|nr:hypothetical protein [Sandaracinaceae bacterium]
MKARNGGTLPAALVRRLGEVPDEVLAVRHQIPVGRITRERLRRGIPAYNRLAWNEAEVALLGTMSDAAVARLLGVTTNAVYQRRAALGIAAFGRSN